MNPWISWAIPLLPLLSCVVIAALIFRGRLKGLADVPACLALFGSSCCSLYALAMFDTSGPATVVYGYRLVELSKFSIEFSLRYDGLSLVMVSVVNVVALLVAIYSRSYMRGDAGYARYYAVFSAFVASMALLVLSNNLLMLYMCWELVGLCSYLLIGFWYQRVSAAKASTKAFLVNRIADCGFLSGILLLWLAVGDVLPTERLVTRLDFDVLFDVATSLATSHPLLTNAACFLILMGAMGKSAQFPFHVWLPDAMEGPTPASALIHAATMVTAGVYLLCRTAGLMVLAPEVLMIAGWAGAITAIMAAFIALFQDDLKRVLAYSTLSQLGYMFMAIGCGANSELMPVAVGAAMFHVITHACFKALLFLASGDVMHAMNNLTDMRRFGGLRHLMPYTFIMFTIGGAALVGLPPLSGFWSKDGILELLSQAAGGPAKTQFLVMLGIAYVTAFLTSAYTMRAYLRTFFGTLVTPTDRPSESHLAKKGIDVSSSARAGLHSEGTSLAHGHSDHDGHAEEFSLSAKLPLMILAVPSILLGGLFAMTHVLPRYIQVLGLTYPEETAHGMWVPLIGTMLSVAGLLGGWWLHRRLDFVADGRESRSLLVSVGKNRLYIDEILAALVVTPARKFANVLSIVDRRLIDGGWRFASTLPAGLGGLVTKFQAGAVNGYAYWMVCGVVVMSLVVLWS